MAENSDTLEANRERKSDARSFCRSASLPMTKRYVGSSRLDNRLFHAVGVARVVRQVCPVVIGRGYYSSIRKYDGGSIERLFDV